MKELRAWIEVENQMFYQGEQFLDSFLRRANLRAFGHLPSHTTYGYPPLTQFTGLLDMNGNKIFEGDIVQVNYGINDLLFEVIYNLETASYEFADTTGERYSVTKMRPCKIIGSIYEKRN